MTKEQEETLVNLKDVAVGLSIIISKNPMENSLYRDVIQKTNDVLKTVLKEMENVFKD